MPKGRPPASKAKASANKASATTAPEGNHASPPAQYGAHSSKPPAAMKGRQSVDGISDNMDWDDPISAEDRPTRSCRQVLRKVVIPASSRSSLGSSLSSLREQSSDYENQIETPATSAVVTPAEPLRRGKRGGRNASGLRGGLSSSRTPQLAPKGKRKHLEVDDLMEADTRLAQTLQEQEYQEGELHTSVTKRSSRLVIEDSDEDDFSLDSEAAHLSASEQEHSSDIGLPKRKRQKTAFQGRLPSRAARDVARRSLSGKTPRQISDSEESALSDVSDASIFTLEKANSDVSEDSDDDEYDVENPIAATVTTPAAVTNTATRQVTASSTSRRRQAQAPVNRRAWRRGGARGEDRATRERRKLEKAHPEILTMWDTLKAVPRITTAQADQPTTITRKLKSFQLEGLDWMMKQERSQWKGGLLGDEMGMGKTIQAVSLIMSDYPARDPTLVVVPPVALMQWQNEINQYTDGKLKVCIYHNSDSKVKKLKMNDLKKYDVIMISYAGLESIYRKESKGWKRDDGLVKENSKIHAIHYHRLILDEAHNIKTRTTGVAKACFALKADFKWCLSGTPVQNRIGEFFSLLRFLQIVPFACYFCKKCPCKELHWSQDESKRCSSCNHTGFDHVSIFNQEILNPIIQGAEPELRREGLAKLRMVTDRIMLRRMKRDHTASMELPPKEVIIHNEFFGTEERDFSSSIMTNTARTFDTYVSRGVMLNNYANIFGLIMQMRQVANHPDLILKKHAQGGQNVLVCSVCDETAEEPIRSRCHHEFCRKCAKDYIHSFNDETPDCPRCHIPLAIDFDQPAIEQDEDNVKKNSIINRIKMEDWTSSTKIEMLVYDLYKLRSQKQTHKSIVFSQFTSMLQLVEWRLRRAGFNTVMLDGSMSPAQRQKSIEYFMNNTDVEVFLVSLKAGGVALNLTEASRVFIVDPWWNPAAEWQSADRCHRIGQRRPCVITRLCIEDSVESRIVMLQEKKANMINGTINNDQVAMEKLTPEDMQFLFRGS